jgi:prepilin-type N-terminal cleavage/methylation domain-containing protein
MKKNKGGFTLVELIVVITIISIIATIMFIVTTANLKDSRDAVRMADLSIIEE